MAEDRISIDSSTVLDNADARQIEFAGEASGERYKFAVRYDLLEALGAEVPSPDSPDENVLALFRQHTQRIEQIGAHALARDPDQPMVVISENDLD